MNDETKDTLRKKSTAEQEKRLEELTEELGIADLKAGEVELMIDNEHIQSIARHLLWADAFRQLAMKAIHKASSLELEDLYTGPGGAYLLVWYGLVFAVCEDLKSRGVVVAEVQNDIDGFFESLRLCRNAVFHIQPKYWSHKLLGFITVSENAEKIHNVHEGLFYWLSAEMLKRGLAVPEDFKHT